MRTPPENRALLSQMAVHSKSITEIEAFECVEHARLAGIRPPTASTNAMTANTYALLLRRRWLNAYDTPECKVFITGQNRPTLQTVKDLAVLGNEAAALAFYWRYFDP